MHKSPLETSLISRFMQPLQKISADTLARRSQRERLVELGRTLTPAGPLVVFRTLAANVHYPPSEPGNLLLPDEEKEFWFHCLREQTLEAAMILKSVERAARASSTR